jgi:hypothetical protein
MAGTSRFWLTGWYANEPLMNLSPAKYARSIALRIFLPLLMKGFVWGFLEY